jgi:signal peptidase
MSTGDLGDAPTEVFAAIDSTVDSAVGTAEPGAGGASGSTRESGRVPRVVGRIGSGLLSLVALGVLVLVAVLTVVPAVSGAHTLTVLSGSMVPTLPVGSVVVDRPVDPASLRIGDVVTYATTDQVTGAHILITHRIVAIHAGPGGETLTTRGDANDVADQRPVTLTQVRGRLWYHVPYIGLIRNALLTRGAAYLALAVALLALAGWLILRGRGADAAEDEATEPEPAEAEDDAERTQRLPVVRLVGRRA